MIRKLTWRNLWRNSRRTIITMASISFAVVLAVVMKSIQKGVFDNLIKNVVSFYSGYIQVHKLGYQEERVIENSFLLTDSVLTKIRVPFVKETAPRLESFALVSTGNMTKGCMLVGTDPVAEDKLTSVKSKIIQGSMLEIDDAEAMVAEGLMKRLKLSLNDTIIMLGQGYRGSMAAGKFRVKGIIKFPQPEFNNELIYLSLPAAENFLNAESLITSIAVSIKNPEQLEVVRREIAGRLGIGYEVVTWKELMPDIENHIRADAASLYIWTSILYLIIGFGVFGTVLMMAAERRFEFGMLIAIGMKKIKLVKMLLSETILISICGTGIGIVFSIPIVYFLKQYPIKFSGQLARAYEQFGFEAIFPSAVSFDIFYTQAFIVLIIALIIGVYPLIFIARLNVVAAMKK